MKRLLGLLLLFCSLAAWCQTPGVATTIRYGASLPSGAAEWSIFILTGASSGLYICENSPSCTSSGQWVNVSSCLANPNDGGCALIGSPSVDTFIGSVGSGLGWVVQVLATVINTTQPINVQGTGAGTVTLGCSTQPGTGSGISLVAPASCTPYILILPSAAGSGYFQCANVGSVVTCDYEAAINIGSSDVTGTLPITSGGTGNTTQQSALNALVGAGTGGSLVIYAGTNWTNTIGCTLSTCFGAENGNGAWEWIQSPLPVIDGGFGLVTLASNAIYKGNGTSAPQVSSISDNGSNVAISETITCTVCVSVPDGGTGLGTLTTGTIYKGNGTSAMQASSITEGVSGVSSTDAINTSVGFKVGASFGTSGYCLTSTGTGSAFNPCGSSSATINNAASTGTVAFDLVKLTGVPSTAVKTATTDIGGIIGICISSCGTTGAAVIQLMGVSTCNFDNVTTAGDYFTISSSTAGQCHDPSVGGFPPQYYIGAQNLGRILASGSGGATSVLLFPPEFSSAGAPVATFSLGSGAGSGSPTVSCAVTSGVCTDSAGQIEVHTGTSPSTNNIIVTINFGGNHNEGSCIFQGLAANTSLLGNDVYSSLGGFGTLSVGATALSASTTYFWGYVCNFIGN